MTIRELFEMAVADGYSDFEIKLQYQDDGGCYCGSCYLGEINTDLDSKTVTLA